MMHTFVLMVLVSGIELAVLNAAAVRDALIEGQREPLHFSNNLPSMHSNDR